MNHLHRLVSFQLVLLFIFVQSNHANADVTFSFNYNDAAGTGFNHASEGQARRDALELAALNFGNAFSSYSAMIVLDVDGNAPGGSLMGAGSNFDGTRSVGFGNDEIVRNKVLFGSDLNGGGADGSISVNFGTQWELDINETPSLSEFDWYSTTYHEFAHVFGFASAILTDGTAANTDDGYGGYDPNGNGSWGAFDEFLSDKDGNSLYTGSNLDEATYSSLLLGGASPDNGLFFNGTNSGLVGLYSPTSYQEGSSGSHLDDENASLSGLLMLAATGPGLSSREFSALEQNIFRDIGYTNVGQITAIPEPSSLAFLGILLGTMTMRRRRV